MSNPLSQFHAVETWTKETQDELNDSSRIKDSSYTPYNAPMTVRQLNATALMLLIVGIVSGALVAAGLLLILNGIVRDLPAMILVCLICLFTIVGITTVFAAICMWIYALMKTIRNRTQESGHSTQSKA